MASGGGFEDREREDARDQEELVELGADRQTTGMVYRARMN
jgi:hypothetical protein